MSCRTASNARDRRLTRRAVGTQITVHWPGEPIGGPDGDLVSVTESRTVTATLARLHITEEKPEDDDRID